MEDHEFEAIKVLISVGHLYLSAFGDGELMSATEAIMVNDVKNAVYILEGIFR